jgi:hypothetical protein
MRTRRDMNSARSGRGRALLSLALIGLLGLLAGCSLGAGPGVPGTPPGTSTGGVPLTADVAILDEPVGGRNITDLACTFEATQIGTEEGNPVVIQVDWSASCGTHKTETFTFRGGSEVFTSTYEDPTGYPITMTFWATIRWEDSRGRHTLRSASAAPTLLAPAAHRDLTL